MYDPAIPPVKTDCFNKKQTQGKFKDRAGAPFCQDIKEIVFPVLEETLTQKRRRT